MPVCHNHIHLFQGGKNIYGGLLAVLLKGMRNIERHLPWHLKGLDLPCMFKKFTPLDDGASSTGNINIPPNDKFLHSGQRLRETVAELLQPDLSGNGYSKRLSLDGFGTRLRGKLKLGVREIQANQAKMIVCVTDKS